MATHLARQAKSRRNLEKAVRAWVGLAGASSFTHETTVRATNRAGVEVEVLVSLTVVDVS